MSKHKSKDCDVKIKSKFFSIEHISKPVVVFLAIILLFIFLFLTMMITDIKIGNFFESKSKIEKLIKSKR